MRTLVSAESLLIDSAAVTHQGHVRKYNEDSIFSDPLRGIWVVADGMGGHKDGNVASAMIVDGAKSVAARTAGSDTGILLSAEMDRVNSQLLQLSNGDQQGLVGSTVAALVMFKGTFRCMWAGDSRCYLIRKGTIKQVSHDHTEVQELVDSGAITPQEALTWPRRNVITRAVGANESFALDQEAGAIEDGDCFVLCSDGLTGHVSNEEILNVASWSSAQEACDKLVALALERGGKDNVSVIVVFASLRGRVSHENLW
jgi:serine/threonine protein phosphatase PrpC